MFSICNGKYIECMDDWKKLAEQGKQLLSEEEARSQKECAVELRRRKQEHDETLRALKPNEYIPDYEQNIRGYFLIKKPLGDAPLNFTSSTVYSPQQEEETPFVPQIGAFKLGIVIPVTAREQDLAPSVRFDFLVAHQEPLLIEYNRCYSMNYALFYTCTYPKKYKGLLSTKGITDASHKGEESFSVKGMQGKDLLIDYLSGRFIAIIQEGLERFRKETKIL